MTQTEKTKECKICKDDCIIDFCECGCHSQKESWSEEFDQKFGVHIEGQWTNENLPKIKSFIKSVRQEAYNEGQEANKKLHTETAKEAQTDLLSSIKKDVEEMKHEDIIGSYGYDPYSEAIYEVLQKLNEYTKK